MSARRLQVVPEVPALQCLLCGQEATTYTDLCDTCAGVFQVCANRVADAIVAARQPARPAAAVDQVPGQLTLDGQEAACRWAHGPILELDARGRCAVCAGDDQ